MEPEVPPADPAVDSHDDDAPTRRESKRLRDRSAPVLVSLPAHPRPDAPHFSTKHYPASAHGERRHTHFPRLPPDHAPGPLPDGASASFSYRGPPQPPVPGAAPPVPPPPGGTPLVLDRERPPPPEYEFSSQQAMLANMLSQRIDQVDQLRTQLAHAEARIASLSARSNPTAALAQAEARAEAAEARLAAIKEAWRGVESYLDMLSRRETEARSAFVRTLNTGEIGVPPSVPVFGAPTSPYLAVRPPVPPNVPARAGPTFPALPPAPVVGGNPVIWRHESGRRRPAEGDDAEPPHKRQRPDRRREREVRKEKARFSDSPSPPPKDKDDLSPPIAAIVDDKDADADADGDEEVDQIVDDVEMAPPKSDRPPSSPADKEKNGDKPKEPKSKSGDKDDDAADAEGSPETDTDLSVDEELLKLSSKSRRRPRERDEYEYDREYARTDFSRPPGAYAHDYRYASDPRYGAQPGWYGDYWPDEYRDSGLSARGQYQPPPPRPADFAQRNGSSGSGTAAPWYAHLKQGPTAQTNTQGQRTCRQCGLPGRYKDGKCVEKWGPGPEGPGTVCDRCRKKMKRVERRGTADASVLASGLGMQQAAHQASFHSAPQTQTQTQTPTTQAQSQTQLSQTQLGTQYSPQRWQNGDREKRFDNGGEKRFDNGGEKRFEGDKRFDNGGEKRYDLLPSHYGPTGSSPGIEERKGRRREREASGEPAPAAVKGEATAVEAQ